MRIVKDKITWIDILKPTRDDLEFLKKQHKFHPIILDELLHFSTRSRVEFYKSYFFLTYHLPMYDKNLKTSRRAEVDFLITENKVITVHYEDLEPLDNFHRDVSNNLHYKEMALGTDSGRTVYYLIQEMIHFSLRQLRHIEENINYVTQEIFKGKEANLLQKISYTKRDVLDYSLISRPQEILLKSFLEVGVRFWGEEARIYLNDLIGDYYKVLQYLENYRGAIESLESTNSQLLSAKTNAVMQRFTILAFLTIPIAILSSFASTSITFLVDLIGATPLRFALIFLGTILVSVIMMIIFKKKGWL